MRAPMEIVTWPHWLGSIQFPLMRNTVLFISGQKEVQRACAAMHPTKTDHKQWDEMLEVSMQALCGFSRKKPRAFWRNQACIDHSMFWWSHLNRMSKNNSTLLCNDNRQIEPTFGQLPANLCQTPANLSQ